MAYHDVLFPVDISYGSSGGPGFKTTVISLDSGAETRFGRWTSPRRQYDVAYGVKSFDQLSTLIDFYITRKGALNTFRYKDFFDFTTASNHTDAHTMSDVVLGTGDGASTQFQLKAQYVSTAGTQYRNLTKPGAVLLSSNGVSVTAFTVNASTGIITYDTAPAVGVVVRAGCEFYVHARFGEDVDDELSLSYDDFASGSISSIPVLEVLDEVPQPESFDFGGATAYSKASDFQLEVSNGRFQRITTTSSGVVCTLPPAGDLELGGPHFYLQNAGSNSITVKDGATTVFTLAGGAMAVLLVYSVSGTASYVGVIL